MGNGGGRLADAHGIGRCGGSAGGGAGLHPLSEANSVNTSCTFWPGGHPPLVATPQMGGSIVGFFSFQDLGPPEGGSIVGVGLAPPSPGRFDIFPALPVQHAQPTEVR